MTCQEARLAIAADPFSTPDDLKFALLQHLDECPYCEEYLDKKAAEEPALTPQVIAKCHAQARAFWEKYVGPLPE